MVGVAMAGHALVSGPAAGQVAERHSVVAEDAAAYDLFGRAVSVSGQTLVIGAYAKADLGLYTGAAYVYELSGKQWVESARLRWEDTVAFDRFGWSVGISGDVLIVGAPTDDDPVASCGNAFIYQRSNGVWQPKAKLGASDPDIDDQFGYAVAADGVLAVVGAHRDDERGMNAGAAYVFRRVSGVWTQEAKLAGEDIIAGDSFGAAVAVHQGTIVVGAYGQDPNGQDSGAAYVFRRQNGVWVQKAKLVPSDGAAWDAFGFSLDIDGDTIVVGSYGCGPPEYSGGAHVFEKSGSDWIERRRLYPPTPVADDRFGFSVSVHGNLILCGAYLEDYIIYNAGAVHVFQRDATAWNWVTRITPHAQTWAEQYGYAVSLDSDFAVVGAPRADTPLTDSGSAFVFKAVDFRDCNGNGTPDSLDLAQGSSLDLNGNDVPDECDPPTPCAGDADGNGNTDSTDLALVLSTFGCIAQPGSPCAGDLNSDGIVDNLDLNLVLTAFGCST